MAAVPFPKQEVAITQPWFKISLLIMKLVHLDILTF